MFVYVSYIMFHSDLFVNDTYVYKYTHSLLLMAWMGLAGKLIVEMPTFLAKLERPQRGHPN